MEKSTDEIRNLVKNGYGEIARENSSCCVTSCCDSIEETQQKNATQEISKSLGYTDQDLKFVPQEANLGLGCGNPLALASLKEGETVVDLGSGGGLDCFLASKKVGKTGKVIGIDMTPEMLENARNNAKQNGYENVEFREGLIEKLPIEDNSAHIVISNCVINLSPEKEKVFKEIYRVLKPSGRMMISDIVWLKEPTQFIKENIASYIGYISKTESVEKYLSMIKEAGFSEVKILNQDRFPIDLIQCLPKAQQLIKELNLSKELIEDTINSINSIKISAIKS